MPKSPESGLIKPGAARVRVPLALLGPAFVAAIAYVDPGNFATNIQSGAQFGYMLVWVIVVSNLMAMLIQTLSAKLGLATGLNLAEHCREHFPRPLVYIMWALMEFVAMATDLAEFLGAALGFHLLFGMGLFPAALLTGVVTFAILGLQRFGLRPFEAVIAAFVATMCWVLPRMAERSAARLQVPRSDGLTVTLPNDAEKALKIAMS